MTYKNTRRGNTQKNWVGQALPDNAPKGHTAAFTLIELLVVVLIIGILAAVAVPQYQKAVMKSRVAQAQISLKALIEAQQAYYLANGEYAVGSGAGLSRLLDIQIKDPGIYTWFSSTEEPTFAATVPNNYDSGCAYHLSFYPKTQQYVCATNCESHEHICPLLGMKGTCQALDLDDEVECWYY